MVRACCSLSLFPGLPRLPRCWSPSRHSLSQLNSVAPSNLRNLSRPVPPPHRPPSSPPCIFPSPFSRGSRSRLIPSCFFTAAPPIYSLSPCHIGVTSRVPFLFSILPFEMIFPHPPHLVSASLSGALRLVFRGFKTSFLCPLSPLCASFTSLLSSCPPGGQRTLLPFFPSLFSSARRSW